MLVEVSRLLANTKPKHSNEKFKTYLEITVHVHISTCWSHLTMKATRFFRFCEPHSASIYTAISHFFQYSASTCKADRYSD